MDSQTEASSPQVNSVNLPEVDPNLNKEHNAGVAPCTTEAGSPSSSDSTSSSDSSDTEMDMLTKLCNEALDEYKRVSEWEERISEIAKAAKDVYASVHRLIGPRPVNPGPSTSPERNCTRPSDEDMEQLEELLAKSDDEIADPIGMAECRRAMEQLISLGFFEEFDSDEDSDKQEA